jgi:hypothetical protein
MKYAIIKCSNGAFVINSEWSDLTKAKTQFHGLCQTLWNAKDVATAKVEIVDEQLNIVEDYREYIHHDSQPEPEPEAEGTKVASEETE